MAASGSESIEYKTLARFLDKLISTFKASHLTVANELVVKEVVPQDVLDNASTIGLDDEMKTTLIMKSVLDQVQVSPGKYHDFMALPSFNDPCFRSLHTEITAVYETLKAEVNRNEAHTTAVVSQSVRIMDVVSQATHQIEAGNSGEAVVLLERIKGDARTMHKETQHLIQQLKNLKEYYKREVERSTSKISEATIRRTQLNNDIQRAEIDLQSKRNHREDLQRRRSSAENSRDSARRESDRHWEENRSKTGATVGVGLFGLFLTVASGGMAAPFAVAATAACGASAADHSDKMKKAEDEIRQYNSEISDIDGKISTCDQHLSNMRQEVQQLLTTLQEYEEKCKEYEEEKQHVQETIAFLQESQSFWGEFENLIELRSIRTDILHKIIQKADSEENRVFLQRRGTHKMVTSFVDAWEQLRKEAQSGTSYIFKVSFKCTQCNREFTDLPCMKDGNFVCSYCNQITQALEN